MSHLKFYNKIKTLTVCKISVIVPEIFKFDKCVLYANDMSGSFDIFSSISASLSG